MRCGKATSARIDREVGVEHTAGGLLQHGEAFQCPAGAVPPVGETFIDGAVGRDRGEEAVQALDAAGDGAGLQPGVVHQEQCGGDDVRVDPGVPVVDIPVEAQPVPVEPVQERAG